MDLSDKMISCNIPDSCCQQNLECFDMLYYPQVSFHERAAMIVNPSVTRGVEATPKGFPFWGGRA